VTMVKIRNLVRYVLFSHETKLMGQEVKYGVISTTSLQRDLKNWETLYISGRLQKPHLPLLPTSTLKSALEVNKKTALSLALILLGPRFTEFQLWEKIAGISYAGDPRMSIPGAENPEKVRNIVRGQGSLDGFRVMYGDLLIGLHWEGDRGEKRVGEWKWNGEGDEYLIVSPVQSTSPLNRRGADQ
jgi:translocator assembly and maintenance protein 41